MPNFKVKAVYDYSSPHEDDLGFSAGQIITVTEEEDADWYIGEYIDVNGEKQAGLFPKNFVEKYEPEPPPRPNRASRHKPLESPAPAAVPPTPEILQQEPAAVQHEEPEVPKPKVAPVEIPSTVKSPLSPTSPPSATSAKAPEESHTAPAAPKPAPPSAAAEKKAPPVAAKPSSFRDRIAAFNQASAAPIAPFKPAGAPTTFIKKPFVAPPPSRNAYVPPPREAPQVKTYRREEDPEIAARQAQDQESAERAGLAGAGTETAGANDGDEDQPKPTSLKERIALLQKQQAEQAQRAAALHKEKPKKPPMKKRTESHQEQREEGEGAVLEKTASTDSKERGSMDTARPAASRRISHLVKSPESTQSNRELMSDANDADQSGAGDTVDSDGGSTSVEDDEDRPRAHAGAEHIADAPGQEPATGAEAESEEGEEEEEEEEDEMDAETRRKLELRERMAKMSGGMGMAGMFGGAGGLPMGLPPKKKKSGPEKKDSESSEQHALPPRIPMIPIPGMSTVRSPEPEETELAVGKEESTPHHITHTRDADEVPDAEDVVPPPVQRTQTGDRGLPPPVPTDRRPMPPPLATPNHPAPPPVPSASRPVPPASDRSSRSGSESGDELTEPGSGQTVTSPPQPPSKRSSYFGSGEYSQDSPDRRVPPIPLGSPTMSPTIMARPPPPPPPTAAPPSRQPTMDNIPQKVAADEEETEYEGDYDTDIAPGATHKDALKAHIREQSMDESTTADEETPPAVRSPPIPPFPPSTRAAPPPPPPHQPPLSGRPSVDAPRVAPPPPPMSPPSREPKEGDEDYDPYRYSSPPRAVPPPPRGMPPPPSQPPPPQNRAPPLPSMLAMPPPIPPQGVEESSGDDDDLYSNPPPRKSHDRPPPPPPSAPPHQQRPPPPPQDKPAPPPPQDRPVPPPPPEHTPSNYGIGRKSLDVNRAMQGRVSMDQPRPSQSQEFIAGDVDLGVSSHWWTQPNVPPPSIQGRKDVLIEVQESKSHDSFHKAVYVLYLDYSQTIITADFDAHNVSDVHLEQRHEPPPTLHRQDQLEQAHETYGVRLAKDIEGKQNTVVGDGTPHAVVHELLKFYPQALKPISTRAFGALVYANLANASIQQHDMIRPGDIITFRNAKFQGKHGAMHAKYSMDVGKPDHVGVVMDWDGTKKKIRAWEQGRESKKVKVESFKMGDLRSGEVRVWRVMGREWVGWGR